MTYKHYLLIFTIAAIAMLTGCTATSRLQLTAAGRVLLPVAEKVALDAFNVWLNEQTM